LVAKKAVANRKKRAQKKKRKQAMAAAKEAEAEAARLEAEVARLEQLQLEPELESHFVFTAVQPRKPARRFMRPSKNTANPAEPEPEPELA
jgi:hypothetical protein